MSVYGIKHLWHWCSALAATETISDDWMPAGDAHNDLVDAAKLCLAGTPLGKEVRGNALVAVVSTCIRFYL
jgi:hypothetical protein